MASRDSVGKAVYETSVDPSGLKKGLDDAGRQIKRTGDQVEDSFAKKGTRALDKFGAGAKRVDDMVAKIGKRGGLTGAILGGAGIGAGIGAFSLVSSAISASIDQVGKSIDLASDKVEAAGKANLIFGDSYGMIERASKSAATSVGLSAGKYLDAAGNLGNLLNGFDITGEGAARMSKEMIQLAADMGSFNNAGTQDVTEAMGAAFRGETEPIRAFGVMIDAAAVKAKAMELGLAGARGELTKNARAQATYALILDQTRKQQGNFALTAEEMANSSKTLDSVLEDLQTEIGTFLLGPAKDFVAFWVAVTTGGRTAGGSVQAYLAEQRRIAAEAAGSSDGLKTLVDAFTLLTVATDPEQVMPAENARRLLALGKVAGQTGTDVLDLWSYFREGGKSIDEAEAAVRSFLMGTEEFAEASRTYIAAWHAAWIAGTKGVGDALGPGNPDGPAWAVQSANRHMMQAMDAVKEPWKADWQALAAWARDPFTPSKLEDWIAKRAEKAAANAAKAAREGKPAAAKRWQAIADAMSAPVMAALLDIGVGVDDAVRAITAVRRAGNLLNDVASGWFDVFGSGGIPDTGGGRNGGRDRRPGEGPPTGRNASGTSSWRGGWTWVGERGPELMRLPQGTAIASNERSMEMAGHQVIDHRHTITAEGAANLRSAGFDSDRVGRVLAAAGRQSGQRYSGQR